MDDLIVFSRLHLLMFFLVLTRLSFVLMAMPAIGGGVPRRIKAFIALSLTVLFLSFLGSAVVPQIEALPDLAVSMAREAAAGAFIGLIIRLLITGFQLAGELIDSTSGMQLGSGFDPVTEGPAPVMSNVVVMLVTAVFIGLGGHHMIIEALLHSFKTIPPGRMVIDENWVSLMTFELTHGMAAGVRAGAPIVAALLLSNVIAGLLSRTLPQLNILAVGLNINAIVLLTISSLVLGSIGFLFEAELAQTVNRLVQLLASVK